MMQSNLSRRMAPWSVEDDHRRSPLRPPLLRRPGNFAAAPLLTNNLLRRRIRSMYLIPQADNGQTQLSPLPFSPFLLSGVDADLSGVSADSSCFASSNHSLATRVTIFDKKQHVDLYFLD